MVMMTAFEKCGRGNYQSIAFPAIGMGTKGYCSSTVAETFVKAVTEYCISHPKSSVNRVVLYLHPAMATAQQLKVGISVRMLGCCLLQYYLPI